jgi:hypothetical protein
MTTARFVVAAARITPPRHDVPEPGTAGAAPPGEPSLSIAAPDHHTGPGTTVTAPAAEPGPGLGFSIAAPDHRAGPGATSTASAHHTGPAATVTALRIAGWQVAVVIGFVAVGRGWVVQIGAGTAVVLLAATAVRVRGVWLSSLAWTWLEFIARRRNHPGRHLPLPRGSSIAPDGMLVGAEGLTVVTRTREAVFPELETDADGPELDLQLVLHRGPQQPGPSAWLAITARRHTDVAHDEMLRVTLGNVLRRLRKSGRELTGMSAVDLHATLAGIAHAGPSRERWRGWRSGPVTQVALCFAAAPRPALDRLLAEGRDAALTIAIRPAGDGVLRIAATSPEAAGRAVARLVTLGAHLGVRLHRLDGRHGPAVLASLPIGGTL